MSAGEPFTTYSSVTLPLTTAQRSAIAASKGGHTDDVPATIDVFLQMDGTFDCGQAVASTWELDAPVLGRIRITLNPDWTYELYSLA